MKHLLAWVAWWLALFWLWLLLAGDWNAQEWVAAALAAALGATLAELARTRTGLWPRPPLCALLDVPQLLLAVVADFGILAWALFESAVRRDVVRGRFVVRTRGTGDLGSRGIGLRAWLEVAATYSPNAYVVEIEPPTDSVLFHELKPRRFSESPV